MAGPSFSLSTKSSFNFNIAPVVDHLVFEAYPDQQVSISGTVTDDATREPMPGVNVLIKGTTLGTLTSADGKYSLPVTEPDNATLVFSFIGYGTREVAVSGK